MKHKQKTYFHIGKSKGIYKTLNTINLYPHIKSYKNKYTTF